MQGTVSKLSAAEDQLLEEPLFVSLPPRGWEGVGNLAVSHGARGCTALQDRPNRPSSRPVFSAGPTKHPKL